MLSASFWLVLCYRDAGDRIGSLILNSSLLFALSSTMIGFIPGGSGPPIKLKFIG
jgi:hypothetical protein